MHKLLNWNDIFNVEILLFSLFCEFTVLQKTVKKIVKEKNRTKFLLKVQIIAIYVDSWI